MSGIFQKLFFVGMDGSIVYFIMKQESMGIESWVSFCISGVGVDYDIM